MDQDLFPVAEKNRDLRWRADFFHDSQPKTRVLYDFPQSELAARLVGEGVFFVLLGHFLFPKFRSADDRFRGADPGAGPFDGSGIAGGFVLVRSLAGFALYL